MCDCERGKATAVRYSPIQRKMISLDQCIDHVLAHLWANNITTHGCCCGHNIEKPSIIFDDKLTKKDGDKLRQIIKQVDDREFKLLSWNLAEI